MNYYLGVDIGASTVKLGLWGADARIVGRRYDRPSLAHMGPAATMKAIAEGMQELLKQNDIARRALVAVGACCPTPVDRSGMCVYPTNIGDAWQGVNVEALLTETLSVSATLLNDGDAAAYREYGVRTAMGRASEGMAQFITGTGLGGALIVRGEIFRGAGAAAELGHVLTDSSPAADRCGCGATGCVETRSSLIGLSNLVRMAQKSDNSIPDALGGDPMDVAKRLRRLGQADEPLPIVTDIWDTYFQHIGRAARSVANTVGCQLVVISGGAQEREEDASPEGYGRFLARGVAAVERELYASFPHLQQIAVEWSVDTLPDAACYGAAQYVADRCVSAPSVQATAS